MKITLTFIVLILITACQSSSYYRMNSFLDNVEPDIGRYGFKAESSAGYWSITNSSYSDNKDYGLLNLYWTSLGGHDLFMWLSTSPGEVFCKPSEIITGHGSLKVNGRWVGTDVLCTNGTLLFTFKELHEDINMNISAAVIFDYLGNPSSIYDLRVTFDNTGILNAMKYAQLRSEQKQIEKSNNALKSN